MARPEDDPTPEPEPGTTNTGAGHEPDSHESPTPDRDVPAEDTGAPSGDREAPTDDAQPTPSRRRPDLDRIGKKVLLWAGVFVAVLTLYYVLASFLPRWWAQRIVDLVGGSSGLGMWWGDRKSTPSELQSRGHLVCRLLLDKNNFEMAI